MEMSLFDLSKHPHRRYNPLTGDYILVSPHRMMRPWQGQIERVPDTNSLAYDPKCYLCPSNERAGGVRNPNYKDVFVFTNDFRALLTDTPAADDMGEQHPLLPVDSVRGTCRVICFSPRHDLSLPNMKVKDIQRVIDTWITQSAELGQTYKWVQIFENKGEMMGCSNPHPHGQIWAIDAIPNEPHKEDLHQSEYFAQHQRALLLDYAALELEIGERVVMCDEHWLVVVPFWAIWPFETLLLPHRRTITRLTELEATEREHLAITLKKLLSVYDQIFACSFPYSMGWHGAPFERDVDYAHWQVHAHFYPPLLRSATVKKFMVGYELLSEVQRDLTAESIAKLLRDLVPNIL
jgi:UDPglucose--hexose-1-phosphate uridylyltransferase